MITSHMHIKAPGFPRHARDDDLVNNFMSGFALADAMKTELLGHGYSGVELIGEDYGWLVVAQHKSTGLELCVVLSSLADAHDAPDDIVELMVAIEPQKLTKGALWWKKDISVEVGEHSDIVFGFLRSSAGVEVLEEFSDIG